MKTHREINYSAVILASALDGDEWSASRPCRFTRMERDYSTHWTGGWVDPRTGLGAVE
jgi:hypothetical protein